MKSIITTIIALIAYFFITNNLNAQAQAYGGLKFGLGIQKGVNPERWNEFYPYQKKLTADTLGFLGGFQGLSDSLQLGKKYTGLVAHGVLGIKHPEVPLFLEIQAGMSPKTYWFVGVEAGFRPIIYSTDDWRIYGLVSFQMSYHQGIKKGARLAQKFIKNKAARDSWESYLEKTAQDRFGSPFVNMFNLGAGFEFNIGDYSHAGIELGWHEDLGTRPIGYQASEFFIGLTVHGLFNPD